MCPTTALAESLADRIDAEFAAAEEKIKQMQKQQIEEYEQRQQRLEKLEEVLDAHMGLWRPRLETLSARFADRVKVTPKIVPARREATLEFQSDLAHVLMKFSAAPDDDVRQIVFQYDLEIVPVFMKFESHSELKFPLDQVDAQALGEWIDERIMNFVRAYLAMHENRHYLQDHLVEDPVAKLRFPKYAAGAKLERDGKTIYFISEATRRKYDEQQAGPAGD